MNSETTFLDVTGKFSTKPSLEKINSQAWQLMIFHEQPICKNCFSKILIETASYMGINWRCWTCKSAIDYGSEPFEYMPPKRTADYA